MSGRKYEAEYKKRDAQYTRASVVMVMAFIVCNTPRFIPNVMEIFVELDQWPQVSTECFVKFLYIHYLLSHFKNFVCKAKTNVYHVRQQTSSTSGKCIRSTILVSIFHRIRSVRHDRHWQKLWPHCAELACTACTADNYVHGGNQAFDLDRKCRSEMKMKIYSSVDVKISSRELALASSPYSQT